MISDDDGDASIVERAVDLAALLTKKSYFLFGARQTGKATWVRHALPTRPHLRLVGFDGVSGAQSPARTPRGRDRAP